MDTTPLWFLTILAVLAWATLILVIIRDYRKGLQ